MSDLKDRDPNVPLFPRSTSSGPSSSSPIGRIGRYALLKRLGQGGMAEVFLARQEGPGEFSKKVVVKRMLPHLAENKRYVDMFLREARVAARLNHPNVVQLFELGQDDGAFFLAMEHIDGLTLYRLAKRAWSRGKALPTEVIVRMIADAALGLHHAHTLLDEDGQPAGLVHRDISPDNLMITRDGVTKVLDFGIAKGQERSGVTKTGELKGKVPYMSPEQAQGHQLDARTDLFSLGVTFYWLLTAKRPFDGPTEVMTLKRLLDEKPQPPSTLNDKVPPALDRIVMRLLDKSPEKRYRSGQHLHDRLVVLLGGESTHGQAQSLVTEMMSTPDPDELDEETLDIRRRPASEPISTSFASTAITVTSPGEVRRRGALIGLSAAATTGFIGAVVLLLIRPPPPAPPEPAPPPPPPPLVMQEAAPDPLPAEDVKPELVKPELVKPELVKPELKPELLKPAAKGVSLKSVTLKGPAHLDWKMPKHGALNGALARVPASTKTLIVIDKRRKSKHYVPITGDVADFNALPQGEVKVQIVPHARMFLGGEFFGESPPLLVKSLPVGEYTFKLKSERLADGKPFEGTWEVKIVPGVNLLKRNLNTGK